LCAFRLLEIQEDLQDIAVNDVAESSAIYIGYIYIDIESVTSIASSSRILKPILEIYLSCSITCKVFKNEDVLA
jgi:hypothetical protein